MAPTGCYPGALRFFHSQHLYPISQGPEALPTASFCQWEETLIQRSLISEASGLTAEFCGQQRHLPQVKEVGGRWQGMLGPHPPRTSPWERSHSGGGL